MADHRELISKFSDVTGLDRERAAFHLESASWNLELALGNFYEDSPAPSEAEVEGSSTDPEPFNMGTVIEALESHHLPQVDEASQTRYGNVRNSYGRDGPGTGDDRESFYVGGSEQSGQQVLGPPRSRSVPGNLVSGIFDAARQHGAKELDSRNRSPAVSMAFHGTGYRLGEHEGSIEEVPGSSSSAFSPQKQVDMTLKMWKTGFSVDSGDLRPYSDRKNRQFLETIRMGRLPEELTHAAQGSVINLNMEDHTDDEFVKPRVLTLPFSGKGRMLGSPAPSVSSSQQDMQARSPDAQGSRIVRDFHVNPSEPVTTVQIRLSDGQRFAVKFNSSSTVRDIRDYIRTAHPLHAGAPFVLMTTFPNRELTDETQTLEQADLCNAVIVQQLK
ncbi:NSFL1 cofactor p47-like [Babylonia areolata]|uniref:NSFL1 cofactor p47-like n=1 Tax=Babylonia areolata TaxID=304850 RepID=UPI003FCEF1B6